MTKNIITATAPDGTTFTRKSTHAYTAAVIIRNDGTGYHPAGWGLWGFRASVADAEKLAAKIRNENVSDIAEVAVVAAVKEA